MQNEQNNITETKHWALDQLVKLSQEQNNINALIRRQSTPECDREFNKSFWDLKHDLIQSQIKELMEWIISN